jgi:hypothetical protein
MLVVFEVPSFVVHAGRQSVAMAMRISEAFMGWAWVVARETPDLVAVGSCKPLPKEAIPVE